MNRFTTLRSRLVLLCLMALHALPGQAQQLRPQTGTNAGNPQTPGNPNGQSAGGNPNVDGGNAGVGNSAARDPGKPIQVISAADAVSQGLAQTAPQQPFAPLSPEVQQYLVQVLDVWEQRTAQIQQFQCEFQRWEYDPGKHDNAPFSIARGLIKFAKPDKGVFKVNEVVTIADKADQPKYQVDPRNPFGDWWVCDGKWVHQMDRNQKKATRTELPPEMRGNQIHLSPIPFLFGVKSIELQRRYWLRPIAPPQGNSDVWIEAYPKRADDAGNYSLVVIVLDRDDNLPKSLTVFLPQASQNRPEAAPQNNPHREVYEFTNRDLVGGLVNAIKQKVFMQDFIDTKLPSDWEIIEEPWVPEQPTQQTADAAPYGTPPLGPTRR